jgi:hypothetical protein
MSAPPIDRTFWVVVLEPRALGEGTTFSGSGFFWGPLQLNRDAVTDKRKLRRQITPSV